MPVLAFDPGSRETGCVLVGSRQEVLSASVISRAGEDWDTYLRELDEAVEAVAGGTTLMVALEGVVAPNPHVRMSNVTHLLNAAQVLGALWCGAIRRGIPVVIVRPGGNGSGPLAAYPPELVGPRETSGRSGIRRHCRSAYDVALAATRLIGESR